MSVLKSLAVEHPYYCSESNYYSNEAAMHFESMTSFLEEFGEADRDMNLCFRWDVRKNEESDGYRAEVFIMQQRKGNFRPCSIESVTEEEAVAFKAYAEKHLAVLQAIWNPLWTVAE